jgi:hypothetical protein
MTTPNGLRLSRLADCAGLGSSIHRFAKEHTNEDSEPKDKSAPTAGWAFLAFLYFILAIIIMIARIILFILFPPQNYTIENVTTLFTFVFLYSYAYAFYHGYEGLLSICILLSRYLFI